MDLTGARSTIDKIMGLSFHQWSGSKMRVCMTAVRARPWRVMVFAVLVPMLAPAQTFAQPKASILQRPFFILTCDVLTRIGNEQRYFADSVFTKEAQECTTDPSLKVSYSRERWRAVTDSLAQTLEAARKSSSSNPARYNQILGLLDKLQYFSNWVPGIAIEAAATLSKRSNDVPLDPMPFDASMDPAIRVTRFFDYLSMRAAFTDLEQRSRAIIKEALDTGKLAPVLPVNAIAITCPDFVDMLSGLSVEYAVTVEALFSACYSDPNGTLAYDPQVVAAFLEKNSAGLPPGAARVSVASFSPLGPLGERYRKINEPYAAAYRAEQARIAAEQQRNAELIAKAERLSKMANPHLKGLGLDTPREKFLAIKMLDRDVWSCATDTRLHSETCTGRIRIQACRTLRTVAGDHSDCKLIPDTEGAASPELLEVSTLVGTPVVEIVVSYFEEKIESIAFVMAAPPAFSRDETDYAAALTEKFGEPLKDRGWEGEDTHLFLAGRHGLEDPAVIILEKPSVAAAKLALMESLEDEKRRADQQEQLRLRNDL